MLSDFITSDPKLLIFELGLNEWEEAIKKEPWVEENSKIRSATAIISQSKENYFDNTSILEQYKRLISLIKYSSIFKSVNFRVDLLVDNATTHTKCQVDINLFAKSMNRSTPVEFLTWTKSEGNEEQTDCLFRRGDLEGSSKGLFNLCKELGIINTDIKYYLDLWQ
ncbi:unnamed protein product [Brachionus calyciflorus]|uniref:Uncharacterized protein n=1 Tax=Brachionus calyciflorus TaxID=104777 RepID=A0A814QMA9_9BILA|nr:unnamed protein product [Brachionus calyciflorus]